ncbi:putative toxin-antitoxin system toxin component, PIN family [Candidatus Acetothermia bacterium]|nr:putative toxin-antitoxin system toxin component, PIN family [Candidatus Acetothermia bacterium]MBI3643677.1 putative toxin-antitoxin system toxin component, PIN family [Candidatus Acetothermia bacterium]
MKILLDTNVLFSGLGFQGVVGRLLETLVTKDHTIVTSEFILEELREKIRIKFKGPQKAQALDLLLHILAQIDLDVKAAETYRGKLALAETFVPEQDAPILALAMLDEVDYFVTGDLTHFQSNPNITAMPWRTKILSPRELLELLT